MFLSKSDEEITANRKIAKDLVDKWVIPFPFYYFHISPLWHTTLSFCTEREADFCCISWSDWNLNCNTFYPFKLVCHESPIFVFISALNYAIWLMYWGCSWCSLDQYLIRAQGLRIWEILMTREHPIEGHRGRSMYFMLFYFFSILL